MGQAIADIIRIVNTSILQQLPDAYLDGGRRLLSL